MGKSQNMDLLEKMFSLLNEFSESKRLFIALFFSSIFFFVKNWWSGTIQDQMAGLWPTWRCHLGGQEILPLSRSDCPVWRRQSNECKENNANSRRYQNWTNRSKQRHIWEYQHHNCFKFVRRIDEGHLKF